MEKLSTAADQAIVKAQELMESSKSHSTALALPPRETPLTVTDFGKIEQLIEKHGEVKRLTKADSNPKKDADGHIYGWEFAVIETGLEIMLDPETDPRLIEAIQRPATSQGTVYHFTRLAGSKRNTRGQTGFQVILEDLAYDLRGKSEWAIMKACEFFRAQPSPFFPDHSEILAKVDLFDAAARSIKTEGDKS